MGLGREGVVFAIEQLGGIWFIGNLVGWYAD